MAATYVIHNYHAADSPDGTVHIMMDDKIFRIPPGEPFEIETDSNGRKLDTPEFYARQMLAQYGPLYGLTEIPIVRNRTGITLDVDSALAAADSALILNRHRHINLWASDQLTTRVSKNLPVLPPTGFVAESIKLLNVDLGQTYNIRPIGWDFRPTGQSNANPALLNKSGGGDQGEEIVALRAQNDELAQKMVALESMLLQLVGPPAQEKPSKPSITPHGNAPHGKG